MISKNLNLVQLTKEMPHVAPFLAAGNRIFLIYKSSIICELVPAKSSDRLQPGESLADMLKPATVVPISNVVSGNDTGSDEEDRAIERLLAEKYNKKPANRPADYEEGLDDAN